MIIFYFVILFILWEKTFCRVNTSRAVLNSFLTIRTIPVRHFVNWLSSTFPTIRKIEPPVPQGVVRFFFFFLTRAENQNCFLHVQRRRPKSQKTLRMLRFKHKRIFIFFRLLRDKTTRWDCGLTARTLLKPARNRLAQMYTQLSVVTASLTILCRRLRIKVFGFLLIFLTATFFKVSLFRFNFDFSNC